MHNLVHKVYELRRILNIVFSNRLYLRKPNTKKPLVAFSNELQKKMVYP